MSMDTIPDDCLLHIFLSIHDTHTLFRCLPVCKRWNCLVSYRLARAERLLDKWAIRGTQIDNKSLCYSVRRRPLVEPILSKILLKSPKLKVVSVGLEHDRNTYTWKDPGWLQRSIDRLFKLESLEGLMITTSRPQLIEAIPPSLKSFYCEDSCIEKGYYLQVKHLIVEDEFFCSSIERFPNVEWLTLRIIANHYSWFEVARENPNIFKNLKILEIDTTWDLIDPCEDNLAVKFIDFCPQLESAHLKIAIDQKVPDDNFRHKNLTNLVLSFTNFDQLEFYRFNLMNILKRFPNIKHFAIKCYKNICFSEIASIEEHGLNDMDLDEQESDDMDDAESGFDEGGDVEEASNYLTVMEDEEAWDQEELVVYRTLPLAIVTLLKKLVLLDMRGIVGIDQTSAEFVRCQFQRNRRMNGKLYYGRTEDDEIKRDWPELFDEQRDSSTFNYMAKYFFHAYRKCGLIRPNEVANGHNNAEEVEKSKTYFSLLSFGYGKHN